jgi:Abortive infection alpha
MPDDNKIRDAADAIKGIAEAVPIYQDVVQPAAKEVGTALETISKSIHIALAPVSALIWGYDRIKDYLNQTLTEKLKNLPVENVVSPNPVVAGPIVEALRFAAHESSLRELYANLLATSMDVKTSHEAHPAFIEAIRQITPDEAHLFKHLTAGIVLDSSLLSRTFPLVSGVVYFHGKQAATLLSPFSHFSRIPSKSICKHPSLLPGYIDNLCRLGLMELLIEPFSKDYADLNCDDYDDLLKQNMESALEFWYETASVWGLPCISLKFFRKELLRVTELGLQFYNACLAEDRHA